MAFSRGIASAFPKRVKVEMKLRKRFREICILTNERLLLSQYNADVSEVSRQECDSRLVD
jgi:hypothetical protein